MTSIRKTLYDWWMNVAATDMRKRQRQALTDWNKENISPNAANVKDILFGFKYVVEVDYYKIFETYRNMNGTRVYDSFQEQFCYPNKELGDHSHLILLRGMHTNDEHVFERDEFGGDSVFVGTNNEHDAMIFALKYK